MDPILLYLFVFLLTFVFLPWHQSAIKCRKCWSTKSAGRHLYKFWKMSFEFVIYFLQVHTFLTSAFSERQQISDLCSTNIHSEETWQKKKLKRRFARNRLFRHQDFWDKINNIHECIKIPVIWGLKLFFVISIIFHFYPF